MCTGKVMPGVLLYEGWEIVDVLFNYLTFSIHGNYVQSMLKF